MQVGDKVEAQWGLKGPKAAYSGLKGTIREAKGAGFKIDFDFKRLMRFPDLLWYPCELELLTEGSK